MVKLRSSFFYLGFLWFSYEWYQFIWLFFIYLFNYYFIIYSLLLFFWQKLVWIENNPIFCKKTGQLDIEKNTYLAFCFFDCCRKCNLQYHDCGLNPANNHAHCLRQAYGCASKCLTESSMSISIEGWWYFKEAFWRTVCWSMNVVDYCKIINEPKTVFLRKRLKNAKGHAHDVGDHLLEKIVLRQIHSVLQFRLETRIKTRFSARCGAIDQCAWQQVHNSFMKLPYEE